MEGAEISPTILLALQILVGEKLNTFVVRVQDRVQKLDCSCIVAGQHLGCASLDSTWVEIKLFDFENNAGVVRGDLHSLYLGSLSIARNHR